MILLPCEYPLWRVMAIAKFEGNLEATAAVILLENYMREYNSRALVQLFHDQQSSEIRKRMEENQALRVERKKRAKVVPFSL